MSAIRQIKASYFVLHAVEFYLSFTIMYKYSFIFLVQLWQLHVAEQMIIDDEEANPKKYMDKKFMEDAPFDEENSIQYTKAYYEKALLPKTILASSKTQLNNSFCFLIFESCRWFDNPLLFG